MLSLLVVVAVVETAAVVEALEDIEQEQLLFLDHLVSP